MADAAPGEPLFQTALPHVALRRVRSTLLVASYRMVQEMGRAQDFAAVLAPEVHAEIVSAVAGTWLTVETAVAHYQACEALGLSTDAQVDVGRTVGARVRGTLFGTAVSLSREVGATPWTVFPAVPRLWPRVFEGSSLQLFKLGPKEGQLIIRGLPLVDIRYFRKAFRGQIVGLVELFCTRAYVQSLAGRYAPGDHAMKIQWA